jgi:hypothetical protein
MLRIGGPFAIVELVNLDAFIGHAALKVQILWRNPAARSVDAVWAIA